MAVTQVRQLTKRRGTQAEKNQRSFTLNYLIETNNRNDGAATVYDALPQVGAIYSTTSEIDLGAIVINVDVEDIEGDPNKWMGRVEYSTSHRDAPKDDIQQEEAPLDREPELSIDFNTLQEPVWAKWSDTAEFNASTATTDQILNSAGQQFNPPVTREAILPVITITANEERLDLSNLVKLTNVVNSTSFSGFPDRTLKLNVAGARLRFEQGLRFWEKTYQLTYKDRGWRVKLLDHGYVDRGQGDIVPVKLDGAGNATTGAPKFVGPFQIFREVDFKEGTSDIVIPQAIRALHPVAEQER